MNNTNRALNRVGVFLFGLVLLLGGVAVAVAAAGPSLLASWQGAAKDLDRSSSDAFADTPLAETGQSWILLVVIAVAIVVIVLLLIAIFRQGHGRTGRLISRTTTAGGTAVGGDVVIDSSVAEKTIAAALKHYPGLASVGVTTYSVKGVPTLSIAVSARRGVSPRDIRDHVEAIIARWDETLGEKTPVLLRINGGFVSRTAKAVRVSV